MLLSSQGPVPNSAHLKNLDGPQFWILTELPKDEAIGHLQKAIQEMPCLCPIPFSISRMLAYRLWFYLGGNFRAFKPLVDGDSLALDKLKCKLILYSRESCFAGNFRHWWYRRCSETVAFPWNFEGVAIANWRKEKPWGPCLTKIWRFSWNLSDSWWKVPSTKNSNK